MKADQAFRDWFERARLPLVDKASRIIAKGNEAAMMLFLYQKGTNNVAVIPASQFPSKDDVARVILHFSSLDYIDAVMLLSEAWMVDKTVNRVEDFSDLSKHPARKEVLQMSARRGEMQLVALYPIDRPANRLGPCMEVLDPSELEGAYGRLVGDGRGPVVH